MRKNEISKWMHIHKKLEKEIFWQQQKLGLFWKTKPEEFEKDWRQVYQEKLKNNTAREG